MSTYVQQGRAIPCCCITPRYERAPLGVTEVDVKNVSSGSKFIHANSEYRTLVED